MLTHDKSFNSVIDIQDKNRVFIVIALLLTSTNMTACQFERVVSFEGHQNIKMICIKISSYRNFFMNYTY